MKLMPFSRTICDIMFKAFTNGSSNIYLMQGKLNVYEFVTMLLVMCYSNFSNKVKRSCILNSSVQNIRLRIEGLSDQGGRHIVL